MLDTDILLFSQIPPTPIEISTEEEVSARLPLCMQDTGWSPKTTIFFY